MRLVMRPLTVTPMNVRAVAIGLTVLAHLLALLLLSIERRMSRREPLPEQLQFVSIWPDPPPPVQPQPAVPSPSSGSTRAASASRAIAPVAAPQALAAPSTAPAEQPASPAPAAPPPDWIAEGQKAAARVAADYDKPHTFSPLPNTDLPAKLCKPHDLGKEMQAKVDELLPPLPRDPPSPLAGTPGSIIVPGGVRVGMIGFGIALGGKPKPRSDVFDHMDEQPESSVPDPDNCD